MRLSKNKGLFLFFLIVFWGVTVHFVPKLTGQVASAGETEIYTIEDLYAVRDDLAGSYMLMNDLDFDNPASWENYEANRNTIMPFYADGTLFEDLDVGYAGAFILDWCPFSIESVPSLVVKVNGVIRAEYDPGVTGGWSAIEKPGGEIELIFFYTSG